MKHRITASLLLTAALIGCACLSSCSAVQKAESKIGLTQASIAALNVKLEGDAIAGLMELATKKPGLAATDTALAVINDIAAQIQAKGSGASAVTVAITATGQKALADYQAKAGKAQLLTDGMAQALSILAATAPAA